MELPPLPEKFSAEIVRSDETERDQIFVNGWIRRIESNSGTSGKTIFITRPDKGIIWTLKPAQKIYNQKKLPKTMEQLLNPDQLCNWTEAGIQKIDGCNYRKFIGKYKQGSASSEAYEVGYVDEASGMRRRMVTFDKNGNQRLVVDYLNAKVGPPDSKVFEVPKDYKKTRQILF